MRIVCWANVLRRLSRTLVVLMNIQVFSITVLYYDNHSRGSLAINAV